MGHRPESGANSDDGAGRPIIMTVDFPDERTPGIDHLHSTFTDMQTAVEWVNFIREYYGKVSSRVEVRQDDSWRCPDCRWVVRARI